MLFIKRDPAMGEGEPEEGLFLYDESFVKDGITSLVLETDWSVSS